MRKNLLGIAVAFLLLCFSGCTSNQNQVSAPTSPEQLGYTIDQQQIPQVVMEDSVFLNQETFYCPELSGGFYGGWGILARLFRL